MRRNYRSQSGFTLIEMIVSLGLFSLVVTVAVGALLMLVATNRQLQSEQSVMTNLSFALDSMTREIRTGTHYYCEWSANNNGTFNPVSNIDSIRGDSTNDCLSGNPNPSANVFVGLSFKEGGNSITQSQDRILYYFDKSAGKIFRKVGGDTPESITSSGIYIKDFDIHVSGSDPLTDGVTERDQPVVTIFIEAAETNSASAKTHYMETTVTQRTLDI
jgi:prepilin-type N-terminal cleavage/methylation domain-containing protein